MNSISRMPPSPSLILSREIAALHLALDQRLHLAQRFEHAEVQIAPIDERLDAPTDTAHGSRPHW